MRSKSLRTIQGGSIGGRPPVALLSVASRAANMRGTVVAQVVVVLLAAGLLLSAAGCGGSPGGPANEDVARTSLTAALDAWKGGGKPADLRQRSPEIVMGDTFWEAGRKLANYKIDGPGKTGPKAWRVPVTLTLQAAGNKTETVKLIYIVTTDPAITIFQDAPE